MNIVSYDIFSTSNAKQYNNLLDEGYKYYVVYRIKKIERVAFFRTIENAFAFRKYLKKRDNKCVFADIVSKAKYRGV